MICVLGPENDGEEHSIERWSTKEFLSKSRYPLPGDEMFSCNSNSEVPSMIIMDREDGSEDLINEASYELEEPIIDEGIDRTKINAKGNSSFFIDKVLTPESGNAITNYWIIY